MRNRWSLTCFLEMSRDAALQISGERERVLKGGGYNSKDSVSKSTQPGVGGGKQTSV